MPFDCVVEKMAFYVIGDKNIGDYSSHFLRTFIWFCKFPIRNINTDHKVVCMIYCYYYNHSHWKGSNDDAIHLKTKKTRTNNQQCYFQDDS